MAHVVSIKLEKTRRPQLAMSGDAVAAEDWDEFMFKFETYKERAGVTDNSTSHLLECLSSEVHSLLFSFYGRGISKQTEADLLKNIKRLVVREKNTMACIMSFLGMSQDSDQSVLNYIAKLKAAARHSDFHVKCGCGKDISFTDKMILYKLVYGVSDKKLQMELLTKTDLTLEVAEKMAEANERVKFCQAAMSGVKSTYKKGKSKEDKNNPCSYCGGSQHKDRKKECPAWSAKCSCGVPHHYQRLCRRNGVPPHII